MTSDELEAGDLTFSLAVGPGRSDCRPNRRFILRDAAAERGDETGAGALNPWDEVRLGLASDHQVEFGDNLACLDRGWYAGLDCRDRDGLRFRELVPPDCHEASDCFGRRNALEVLCISLFGPSSAGRPLADDAERAAEATRC